MVCVVCFFFKQKTAYEMRISDWSSDVCSSDLFDPTANPDDPGADDEDDEDADPYEAFRTELRMLPGKWYVIHSYAGFERKVKANIEQRKSTLEVKDDIYQVDVPMQDVVEIKNDQRKLVKRVRIPRYARKSVG